MKVSLSWFLVFLLPVYSEAVDCTLPDYNFIVNRLQVLVDSEGGEGGATITAQDGPYYTCQVQGTIMETYQQLSIIMTYITNSNAAIRVRQFELDCFDLGDSTDWDSRSGSLTTVGNTVDYMNIAVFTNCSACGTNTNDNHCQGCDSNCNSGLMRCTGIGSNDCCAAFESNGMCSPDLNCEQNNFVANQQNNFICECGISSCSDGESFNSTACNCDLTDICLADNPCVNGVCKLGSSPDQYTCNCTGTNYMGTNCSVSIPMITTTSSSAVVTSTTSSSSTKVSTTSSACSNGCNSCNNTCCITCTNGYNLNGCACDPIIDSSNCNVSSCISCAISNCCSHCQDGYSISMCSCVQATSYTTTTTGSATTTPTPTTSTNEKRQKNDYSFIGISISIIIGIIMLLVLVVLIIYVIYYIMAGAAITAAKTKLSEPILFGEAHDNPMYLDPELIAN